MSPTSIIDSEPSIATDIVIIDARIPGAYAHRRVMKDIKIGERKVPAHKAGDLEFPERIEPILRYDQTAACLDLKGTPMSWGWARANGAKLCPDCWEQGFGATFDGGSPAFELEAQPIAEDGTIVEPVAPVGEIPAPSETVTEILEEAARGYADEGPIWDDEWGPQEPPDDDDFPPPPSWDHYGGPVHRGRPVERGPELP